MFIPESHGKSFELLNTMARSMNQAKHTSPSLMVQQTTSASFSWLPGA